VIEREYLCEDGTVLPVRFADEIQAATTFRLDRAHGRDPRTPLGDALDRAGVEGGRRAYEEVGLSLAPSWEVGPEAQGFPYFSEAPMAPDFLTMMMEGCGKLVAQHGSALGIWHDYCLPRSKAAWAELEAADDRAPLPALAEVQAYGFQMTMIPALVCGNDLNLLSAAVQPLFGDEAVLIAHELAQGFDNPTLQADQRLWELGRVALADEAVVDALAADDVVAAMRARRAGGGSTGFFSAVDAFLDEFGLRAEGWDLACPTWREQRAGFWAQVAQLASPDASEPAVATAEAAARRRALVDEITSRLAGDEAALGRFQRRLARIEPYVLVREERALWQVALMGALRSASLRQGERLVREGRLDVAEDVLYLTPDEIASTSSELRASAADRRVAHARWCAVVPPIVIGGDASAPAPTTATTTDDGVLRGAPVSRGVVSGTARVIVDLEDADRLEPGDVLVCVMTSPPWTPLFGVASAVVADTGDIGSHPAIAAREYGIPCVLGVEAATRRIPDGVTVTVDGAAGTVTIVGA
jgi:phosphohistidine swiveling domain-containing protein